MPFFVPILERSLLLVWRGAENRGEKSLGVKNALINKND